MDKTLIILLETLSKSQHFKIKQNSDIHYNQSFATLDKNSEDDDIESMYYNFLTKTKDVLDISSKSDIKRLTKTVNIIVKKSTKELTKSRKDEKTRSKGIIRKSIGTKSKTETNTKRNIVYINNTLDILKKKTGSEWILVDLSASPFLLHTILSTIDEIYSLSKKNQQKKYLQQARAHIAITIGKELLGAKIKMAARKQFSVSSLQKYVQQEHSSKDYSKLLHTILPHLYSEYFNINLIIVQKTSIKYLSNYTDKRVSILLVQVENIFYGIIPKDQVNNWLTHDIIEKIKDGLFISKCYSNKHLDKSSSVESFKLRGFYSYNLPELQELATDFGISIWKVADTREKIFQKNVELKKRKTATMKTKSKNKTKKELYEELKDKINNMKHT